MQFVTNSCRFNDVNQLELEWKPGLCSHIHLILTMSQAQKTTHQVNVAANILCTNKILQGRNPCTESLLFSVKPHTQDFTKNDVFKDTNKEPSGICSLKFCSPPLLSKNQTASVLFKHPGFSTSCHVCFSVCMWVPLPASQRAEDNSQFYGGEKTKERQGEAGATARRD